MQIKVFCLNNWLLPLRISPNNSERVQALAGYISSSDYDVIALQEVWLQQDVKRLQDFLKSDYYCYHSSNRLYNAAGLVLFTKQKPVSTELVHFPVTSRHNLEERLGRKGFMQVELDLRGSKVTIINTHLYAAKDPDEREVVFAQLEKIKQITSDAENIILVGDFNLELPEVLAGLGNDFVWDKSDKTASISMENQLHQHDRTRKDDEEKRIDHIIAKGADVLSLHSQVVMDPVLSDHYGVSAIVVLDER